MFVTINPVRNAFHVFKKTSRAAEIKKPYTNVNTCLNTFAICDLRLESIPKCRTYSYIISTL